MGSTAFSRRRRVAATARRRLQCVDGVSRRWRRGGRKYIPPARRRGGGSSSARGPSTAMPSWPEKLKRTGAVLSRHIASRRCCVRAARALLLGHRAGVAFWSVCCSVLRVWGRAQSVPARRAQFFAAVLRSLRQSCHKLVVAIGARYRRALAPAFGAALSSGLARRLVGRAADSSAGRRLRTPSAPLRAARVAEEAKMPPL